MVVLYSVLETIALSGIVVSALCCSFMAYGIIIFNFSKYNLVRYLGIISLTISVGAIYILCIIFNKWLQWIPALILGPVAIYLWIRDLWSTNERSKCSKDKEDEDLGMIE